MDLKLTDRVVVVVGGHGFIGASVVDVLRAEGAIVMPASRRPRDGIAMDTTQEKSVHAALQEVCRLHGRVDGVVISAAPSARSLDPLRNSEPAQVLQAVDDKAMGFLRVANAALPGMVDAGFGRIVGVSGQNAYLTGNIAGSVRNAALIVSAKHLADSVAGSGVTVNVVNPSTVTDDPLRDVAIGKGGDSRPVDTARLIAFLLSPLSGSISGESIAVGHRVRGVTAL